MAYKAINPASFKSLKSKTVFGAEKGEVLNVLPELNDQEAALRVVNYVLGAEGRLIKRKGQSKVAEVTEAGGITMLKSFGEDFYVVGYGNSVAVIEKESGTVTVVKSDFATDDPFEGVYYGGYFFVCNGGDKIGRFYRTLSYTSLTGSFTAGTSVTGGTSGATAVVLESLSGKLVLNEIEGEFTSGETITYGSASATMSGSLGWEYAEVTNAPAARVLFVFDGRLFAGDTEEDRSEVRFSEKDTGSNPPFTNWTTGTAATDPGQVKYRNAGAVRAFGSIGEQILVLYDNGKVGFRITTIESDGELVQDDPIDFQGLDFGGERGAITTPAGVFYANEFGVWQMTSGGETGVPDSEDQERVSQVLGNFDEYDFSNADLAYYPKENLVLISCIKDASENNIVLAYNYENEAWSEFAGWNIGRFYSDKQSLLGGGSMNGKVWELFAGDDDDGNEIATEFLQEIGEMDLTTRKSLIREYFKGKLSLGSELTIGFDVCDETGEWTENKLQLKWKQESEDADEFDGFASAGWGASPISGDLEDGESMTEALGGYAGKIADFVRLRVRITEQSILPHEVHWYRLVYKNKTEIVNRGMEQV